MDKALFDLMLGVKEAPPASKDLVLVDIDDDAIAQVGIYPWPRSILADGLVTLREIGLSQVVFDIEFIDSSPPGVNKHYLDNGLRRDFDQTFTDLGSMVNDLFLALKERRIALKDADSGVNDLMEMTKSDGDTLYEAARQVAVNNDQYLGQALKFFGASYLTLNRQTTPGEMTPEHRKRLEAAQKFAHPFLGSEVRPVEYNDFFVPLTPLVEGAHSGGMTNVEIDKDGKRRRIRLFEKVNGLWYGQLAFSPVYDLLGQPQVVISQDKVVLKGSKLPDGSTKDISIPLDPKGNMIINWQKQSFLDSFRHVSFHSLVRIKEQEESVVDRLAALSQSEVWGAWDGFNTAQELADSYGAWQKVRDAALASGQEADIQASLETKAKWIADVGAFVSGDTLPKILALVRGFEKDAPAKDKKELADVISLFEENKTVLEQDWKSFQERYADLQAQLKGAIGFVGWSGTGTTDLGANPFRQEYALVGTHPNVVNTILQGQFLTETPSWWSLVLAPLLAFGLVFLLRNLPPLTQNLAGIGIVLAFLAAGLIIFMTAGVFVAMITPLLTMFLSFVAFSLVRFLGSEQEKAFITKAFSTYLSPDVIAEIVQDPASLKLGGDQKWMTAMFTDVKGFSTISEQLSATDLVHLLNEYLSGMSDLVLNEKGTIDKYEGDAIIAFFGAPIDLPDHAARACRAAIRMRQLEDTLNPSFLERKMTPDPLLTRIGINTGEMVVGNMGTERKMNYTIMGSAVNLSARLEGVNKQYGTWILTTEFTAGEAGDDFLFRRLDRVRVVGINEPVRLMNLLGLKDELGEEGRELVEGFHAALEIFETRRWSEAGAAFSALAARFPEDGPSRIYAKRCGDYAVKPPSAEWDGVFNLTEK